MADLGLAATSAVTLDLRAGELMCEAVSVWVTVTYHVSDFPYCSGIKLRPPGRLP